VVILATHSIAKAMGWGLRGGSFTLHQPAGLTCDALLVNRKSEQPNANPVEGGLAAHPNRGKPHINVMQGLRKEVI
jgi:hypothetical protein